MLARIDPLVRMLLLAILLATVLPVTGPARGVAQDISNAAVFMLFFFNGLRLARAEVMAGIGNHRLLLPLLVWVFAVMGLAGWAAWHATMPLLAPTLALGFLYLGVLPSTVQSATAYSSLAGGNVASSVVAAALVNIAGVFITAPLFSLVAGGKSVPFHADGLIKVMTILLLPFVLGQFAQVFARRWATDHRTLIGWLDRTSIAIAVYVAFSGAVEQGLWSMVNPVDWAVICAGVAAMLAFAHAGAWGMGGGLRLPRGDRIAFLFAGGQKSMALGAPLATVLFPPATAGLILLPLLVYHLAQMVLAAPVAARLRLQSETIMP